MSDKGPVSPHELRSESTRHIVFVSINLHDGKPMPCYKQGNHVATIDAQRWLEYLLDEGVAEICPGWEARLCKTEKGGGE